MLTNRQAEEFLALVAEGLRSVNGYFPGSEPVTGCCVLIRDREALDDQNMVRVIVGQLDEASRASREGRAYLKIRALRAAPSGTETSYEIRNIEYNLWGGGFHLRGIDYAISGCQEEWNSALGLYAACRVGLCSQVDVFRIARKAGGGTEKVVKRVEHLIRMHGILVGPHIPRGESKQK